MQPIALKRGVTAAMQAVLWQRDINVIIIIIIVIVVFI